MEIGQKFKICFSQKCVKRNFGLEYLKNIQAEDDWACFCCAAKPLWPLRSIRRALKFYFERETVEADKAVCCLKKQKKEKDAKTTVSSCVNLFLKFVYVGF